ncbi:MAG: hypothetical protein GX130_05275 [Candidatus Hydrogenedens sp.]|nr:hypothetical protein [Candidatus Hydrogenedens sp.]
MTDKKKKRQAKAKAPGKKEAPATTDAQRMSFEEWVALGDKNLPAQHVSRSGETKEVRQMGMLSFVVNAATRAINLEGWGFPGYGKLVLKWLDATRKDKPDYQKNKERCEAQNERDLIVVRMSLAQVADVRACLAPVKMYKDFALQEPIEFMEAAPKYFPGHAVAEAIRTGALSKDFDRLELCQWARSRAFELTDTGNNVLLQDEAVKAITQIAGSNHPDTVREIVKEEISKKEAKAASVFTTARLTTARLTPQQIAEAEGIQGDKKAVDALRQRLRDARKQVELIKDDKTLTPDERKKEYQRRKFWTIEPTEKRPKKGQIHYDYKHPDTLKAIKGKDANR